MAQLEIKNLHVALEDGTEINNTFTANLGIFARAAIDNVQNPRKVPGILAAERAIIEAARKQNPKVVVLLALVIPSGKLGNVNPDGGHPAVFKDENPAATPDARYKAIVQDSRHHDVILLSYEEIDERPGFGGDLGPAGDAAARPFNLRQVSHQGMLRMSWTGIMLLFRWNITQIEPASMITTTAIVKISDSIEPTSPR